MHEITCPCGFVHNRSHDSKAGWVTIQDAALDQIIEAHVQQRAIPEEYLGAEADGPEVDKWVDCMLTIVESEGFLFECPECGRVLWRKPGEDAFHVFRPDEETPQLTPACISPGSEVERPIAPIT